MARKKKEKIPIMCKYCINYNQWVEKKLFFWVNKGPPFCAMAKDWEFPCKEFIECDDR